MIKKFIFLLTLFYCSTPTDSASQPLSKPERTHKKRNITSSRSKTLRSSRAKDSKLREQHDKQADHYEQRHDIDNSQRTNWFNYITYSAIIIIAVFLSLKVKNFFLPSIESTPLEESLKVPQEVQLILQDNAQSQAEIQRLKAIISNSQAVTQKDAAKVYEYAMATQTLSRANILDTPEKKAPTYRILAKGPKYVNTFCDNIKITNVLTMEKKLNLPSYFHASTPNNIIRILRSGNIFNAHRGLYPGAFVSTKYESRFGYCVIGLKRAIEDISPLLTHNDRRTAYWAGFAKNIPVWPYIEGIYIDKGHVSPEDQQKIKDQVTHIKQTLDLFLQKKLAKTNDTRASARIQQLKQDIQKVQVKDTSVLKTQSDIIIPKTWTSHPQPHCLIKNSQNMHEFILGTRFKASVHKDPHGHNLGTDIFGILTVT